MFKVSENPVMFSHFFLTGYKDLQTRKETREMAWSKPGWDECVAYTGKAYLPDIHLVQQSLTQDQWSLHHV